jgi:hypothetical protein
MVKFLDRSTKPSPGTALQNTRGNGGGAVGAPTERRRTVAISGSDKDKNSGRIPNASLVYGVAAGVILCISLYFVIAEDKWLTGFLLLVMAGALLGYALHYMRYR